MSHTTAIYEQQQRNWALYADSEPPIVVEQAEPVPVTADLVPVVALVSVADDLVAFVAPAEEVALALGQVIHLELPDNEMQIVHGHAYNLQGSKYS
ncbi:unnamed protein product [Macrosiphum euphorbiae]|uniref:Uncharacterized protein n=1 Tax=Macrosiphum euphorbiae TaxID=13131 RepID=A0AAV0XWU2_9HEMI|nr:unnamed protein product [Macrosiphum euphorbiae]